MNPVRQWIRKFPEADRRAITDALRSASLAKIRRASRMFEELAHDEGGPSVNVELLSTYNLEPVSAVMQFALNCIPGQAHLHLAPLDAIGAIVAAIEGPWLEAEYPPTLRNALVENLYERLGLQCLEKHGLTAKYQLQPVQPRDFPSWIVIKEKKDEQ